MKFAFSTEYVSADSFVGLCNIAADYGFSGFEIRDVDREIAAHADNLFRSGDIAGAKRKLLNRRLSVSALHCPEEIGKGEMHAEQVIRYVGLAADAGIPYVIVSAASDATKFLQFAHV